MKNYRLLTLFLVGCMTVMLQGHPGAARAADHTPSLGEVLRKLEQQYQQTHAITAVFHQSTTTAAAGAMTTEATGRLYYQKPRQMRWEYDKPERQIFVANRQMAWLYVPADRQISLFDANTLFASPLAQTFFDGIVELKKHFDVTMDSRQSTRTVAVLNLTPKEQDPNIKSLLLSVNLQTYEILGVESRDALGNINRIVLESQNSVPSLEAGLFQLEIPKSTTVLDMDQRELSPSEIENLQKKLQSK